MSETLRVTAVRAADYALGFANAHIRETNGPNMSPQINFWQKCAGGVPGESYCQDFAYSMYLKAWCAGRGLLTGKTDAENQAILLAQANAFSHATHIARTGSCQSAYDAAAVLYRVRSKSYMAAKGDAVYFDFPVNGKRLGRAHHTEIVIESLSNGSLRTVGGNTKSGDAGSQSEGDGVYIRTRDREFVYGFISLV